MGGECSARELGPCHRLEPTASPPSDPRLRELPPRGPHSRRPGERHAEHTPDRDKAGSERDRDFQCAPGWAGICPSRWLGECFRKSALALNEPPPGISGHFPRYATSLCVAIRFWLPTGVSGISASANPQGQWGQTAGSDSSSLRSVAPRCRSNSDYTQVWRSDDGDHQSNVARTLSQPAL